jgi:hypothetical protein
MEPYKKGFITVINQSLIYVEGDTIETLFILDNDDVEDDKIILTVTKCNTILLSYRNDECEGELYCLKPNFPKKNPKRQTLSQTFVGWRGIRNILSRSCKI